MGLGSDIGNILEQYGSGTGTGSSTDGDRVEQDFDHVAQHADPRDLQHGLSETFRSDQTPPFGNMVGQLFGQADPNQRSGMLGQLISGAGPAVLGALLGGGSRVGGIGNAGGAAAGGLGALLERFTQGGGQETISPEDVSRVRPEEVEELANHAERNNPGIIDHMSRFYAQNPTLVKALGGAALAVALGKMANRNR